MWKNNWKIAFRHILKNKTSSAINITGLAIGMAACLLMLQFVSFELSYDRYHENAGNIYRVINDRYQNGRLVQHGTMTYSGVSRAMQEDFPDQVAAYTRLEPFSNMIFIYGDKKTDEIGLAVDNSFLSMFSFPLLAGDRMNALNEPNTIILSEKLARKFLPGNHTDLQSMIGQVVVIENDSLPYKVTGISKNAPENSQLQFDFLMSYVSLYSGGNGAWSTANYNFKESTFWHYIQLKPGVDYKTLQARFPEFSKRHFQGSKVSGSDERFSLQPLTQAHLHSDFENDFVKTGNASTVWGLLIIALFTIVIAWVNYINLATARSVERAREVGVRKVIGALRIHLIRQFLGESLLVNLIALTIALVLVLLAQPAFNQLLGINLSLENLLQKVAGGFSIIVGLSLLLVTGILVSGFYPAFVLSSFRPIAVLKGKFSASGKGIFLRKTLVTGQFAITVCLIIGSLVVYRQLQFMSRQQLGYNMDQMLIVKAPYLGHYSDSTLFNSLFSFKEEIKHLPNVKAATASNRVPGMELARDFNVRRANDNSGQKYTMRNWGVHHDFIDVYQLKLIAGRNFGFADHNINFGSQQSVILNESAVKQLGFSNARAAIGQRVVVFDRPMDVIGVTTDFHQKSLRHRMEPTFFIPTYGPKNRFSVRINPQNLPQTIAAIQEKYEAFFPGNLFDYYFLDEKFNEQYKEDRLFGNVFGLFSGLAIFIACLGLFGLSLYSITQRTKEIGVRKVLGASVQHIVVLLSKDFIKLVAIASCIAFPAAWWVMNNWLSDFAYRTELAWWIFAGAGLLALLIAMATISFHAVRSALSNPVKSLRTE